METYNENSTWETYGQLQLRAAYIVEPAFGVVGQYMRTRVKLKGLYRLSVTSFSLYTQATASITAGYPVWFLISPTFINPATGNYMTFFINSTQGYAPIIGNDQSVIAYLDGDSIDWNIGCGIPSAPLQPRNSLQNSSNQYYTGAFGVGNQSRIIINLQYEKLDS